MATQKELDMITVISIISWKWFEYIKSNNFQEFLKLEMLRIAFVKSIESWDIELIENDVSDILSDYTKEEIDKYINLMDKLKDYITEQEINEFLEKFNNWKLNKSE